MGFDKAITMIEKPIEKKIIEEEWFTAISPFWKSWAPDQVKTNGKHPTSPLGRNGSSSENDKKEAPTGIIYRNEWSSKRKLDRLKTTSNKGVNRTLSIRYTANEWENFSSKIKDIVHEESHSSDSEGEDNKVT